MRGRRRNWCSRLRACKERTGGGEVGQAPRGLHPKGEQAAKGGPGARLSGSPCPWVCPSDSAPQLGCPSAPAAPRLHLSASAGFVPAVVGSAVPTSYPRDRWPLRRSLQPPKTTTELSHGASPAGGWEVRSGQAQRGAPSFHLPWMRRGGPPPKLPSQSAWLWAVSEVPQGRGGGLSMKPDNLFIPRSGGGSGVRA